MSCEKATRLCPRSHKAGLHGYKRKKHASIHIYIKDYEQNYYNRNGGSCHARRIRRQEAQQRD